MDFQQLIAPMPIAEFRERFERGECFVVRGSAAKFADLITLDEIEAKLNDGCNFGIPVEVVREGARQSLVDSEVAWAPAAVRKREVLEALIARQGLLMRNMSQINPRVAALIDAIEEQFRDREMCADLHLYVSPTRNASGYDAHRDHPQHKIFLQVVGRTGWRLFRPRDSLPRDRRAVGEADEASFLEPAAEFVLEPGDLLYMPPGVFHKVRNLGGPRVSFSIPFESVQPGVRRIDRTYIPFRALFEGEQRAHESEQREGANGDTGSARVT
jgi:ribosomal protein L16 Arg81 hydroxylase